MGKILIDPAQAALDNIYAAMETETFGKRTAARLLGGESKLNRLVIDGKLRVSRSSGTQNGKWHCNAADVLRNLRQFR